METEEGASLQNDVAGLAPSLFDCCCGESLFQLLISVNGAFTQLLLDAHELVVLGHTVRAAHTARLDLAGIGGHGDIGNCGVLSLTRAVGGHGVVAMAMGHLDSFQRLGEGANLVDLDEDGIAGS